MASVPSDITNDGAVYFCYDHAANSFSGFIDDGLSLSDNDVKAYIQWDNPGLFQRLHGLPFSSSHIPLSYYAQKSFRKLNQIQETSNATNTTRSLAQTYEQHTDEIPRSGVQGGHRSTPYVNLDMLNLQLKRYVQMCLLEGYSLILNKITSASTDLYCNSPACFMTGLGFSNVYFLTLKRNLFPHGYTGLSEVDGHTHYCLNCLEDVFDGSSTQAEEFTTQVRGPAFDGVDRRKILEAATRLYIYDRPAKDELLSSQDMTVYQQSALEDMGTELAQRYNNAHDANGYDCSARQQYFDCNTDDATHDMTGHGSECCSNELPHSDCATATNDQFSHVQYCNMDTQHDQIYFEQVSTDGEVDDETVNNDLILERADQQSPKHLEEGIYPETESLETPKLPTMIAVPHWGSPINLQAPKSSMLQPGSFTRQVLDSNKYIVSNTLQHDSSDTTRQVDGIAPINLEATTNPKQGMTTNQLNLFPPSTRPLFSGSSYIQFYDLAPFITTENLTIKENEVFEDWKYSQPPSRLVQAMMGQSLNEYAEVRTRVTDHCAYGRGYNNMNTEASFVDRKRLSVLLSALSDSVGAKGLDFNNGYERGSDEKAFV